MSFFSDLSIQEEEKRMAQDHSYPWSEMQIRWRLDDLVRKYLELGGKESDIIQTCSYPFDPISDTNDELLYSSEFISSPGALLHCIKIAWYKLDKGTIHNQLTPVFAEQAPLANADKVA